MEREVERIAVGVNDGLLWLGDRKYVLWIETEEQYRQLIEDLQQQAYILGWQKGEPKP